MLRGELEGADLDKYVEERVLTTTLDKALNWARGNAMFPATFGLACCAIEMMSRRRRARGHRALRLRGLPRLPAPGRPADPLGPRLDQDGADRAPHLRPDARAEVGDRDGRLLVLDGRLQQLRDRPGATSSCRSTCTCRAARRGPRRSCTASSSCAQMIQDDPTMGWRDRYEARGTEEIVERPRTTRRRLVGRRLERRRDIGTSA